MTSPRPLGQQELELIRLYANCQLGMSPRAFEAKWNVTRSAKRCCASQIANGSDLSMLPRHSPTLV
jgi:hypothetical protein